MIHLIQKLCFGMLILLTGTSWAAIDVKGVKFSETYMLGNQSLQLNGAGLRVKVILDVYAAGLYVPKKEHSVAGLLNQAGAKSMQIVLFRDLTGEDFADAMYKGFYKNNSEADIAKFQQRLEEIKKVMISMGAVKKGTVIKIDHVPNGGIKVLMDGVLRGSDPGGDDFYNALLKIWLGQHPVDTDLKQALLGE